MPTLDRCKEMIAKLATEKHWGSDVGIKIYYGILEMAEAGDVWKHRGDSDYLIEHYDIQSEEELNVYMAEELIDTIYYCLHCLMCIAPEISADMTFLSKHEVNIKRNRIYVDDNDASM